MAAAGSNSDGYIRCFKTLLYVTELSIPLVDVALKKWHGAQQKNLQPCSRPRLGSPSNSATCSDNGKPKLPSSCVNCVAWGQAVENVYFSQSDKETIQWSNVNPAYFHKSHVAVAEAFVQGLERDKQYTKIDHFDHVSLLMIMTRFQEFHGGDLKKFNIIKKVNYNNVVKSCSVYLIL